MLNYAAASVVQTFPIDPFLCSPLSKNASAFTMTFEQKLILFWALLFGALWFLRRRPGGVFARAALTWIGPLPLQGERWSRFQLRWAMYACGWLLQFAVVFSFLYMGTRIWPGIDETTWFKLIFFALPIGVGMALLAVIGFSFKAAKAYWFGPNPAYEVQVNGTSEASQETPSK